MEDRRAFARINVKFQIKFLDFNTGKEGHAETIDISGDGMGLVSKEILCPKTPLGIWLIISDQRQPLYTKGEVMWSNSLVSLVGTNQERIGIHLAKEDFIGLAQAVWLKQHVAQEK